jgi:shikimate dehydrogenase
MSAAPPLAGVIGWPVGHSRSPAIHGHWLARYDLPGWYVALPTRPETAEAALRALPALGFAGANVTLPHKALALAVADEATPRARRIGAANTLVIRDGALHADNTDAHGFIANLTAGAPSWRAADGPALVLGAGGASRALLVALAEAGVPEIRLANRTAARAEALAAEFGGPLRPVGWSEAEEAAAGAALIVNATSLGMTGEPPLSFRFDAAAPGAVATDIVYTPLETPFLRAAAARGLTTVDGLGMLLHQAVPGFEAWFGRRPEVDAAVRAAALAA